MKDIQYKIVRSRRKSISIQVKEDLSVIVRAPYWVKECQIKAVVEENEDWILNAISRLKEKYQSVKLHSYQEGEQFLYLGKPVTLKFVELPPGIPARFLDGQLQIHKGFRKNAKHIVKQLYRVESARYLNQRLPYWIDKTASYPHSVKISWANKRWGSCSTRKNLNFSYKLCMLPPEGIDYIIVHELCHLIHPNHSKEFWHEVGKFYPNYKKMNIWLKENAGLFRI